MDAADILRDHDQMETERLRYDPIWDEIARLVLPRHEVFATGKREGTRPKPPDTNLYSSAGSLALDRFGAAVVWMLCPTGQRWHSLRGPDSVDGRADGPEARAYLESLRDLLFRYRQRGGFEGCFHEISVQLGAFGTGCLYVEEMPGGRVRYEAVPLSEIWVARSAWGKIDKVHRKYQLSARAAVQAFGDDCPPKIAEKAEKPGSTEEQFWFLHCVKPGKKGMQYASYHVDMDGKTVVREGGYRRLPYMVGRLTLAPGETYGRSPAWQVLPELRMVNAISKTALISKNRLAEPAWLTADIATGAPLRLTPNAINPGWVDPVTGRPLALPMQITGNPEAADDELDRRHETINDAFMIRLFQILVETPTMTATEVLERAREKAALMSPTMGRLQSEILEPMIWREIDVLEESGVLEDELGPIPEELLGGPWRIDYESTLARDMRADDATAITRTIEQLAGIAQLRPEIYDAFDLELAAVELAKANGMPAKLMRTPEQIKALQAERIQAAQTAQLVEAMPAVTDAARAANEIGVM